MLGLARFPKSHRPASRFEKHLVRRMPPAVLLHDRMGFFTLTATPPIPPDNLVASDVPVRHNPRYLVVRLEEHP